MLHSETMQGLLSEEWQALRDWQIYIAFCKEQQGKLDSGEKVFCSCSITSSSLKESSNPNGEN